jgi:hypothetical protein
MSKLTRKGFLGKTSLGAAAIGALVSVPGLAHVTEADAAPEFKLRPEDLEGPLVAHVRNFKTGEIAVMVGTREIVYRDPQFVKRLLKAAH